jgi:uncharacterized membrane protein
MNKFKGFLDKGIGILAFLCLMVLAAFGMRELLNVLNETLSLVMTILAVGFLTYIVFEHRV